jgi:hypothetical protein
LFWQESFHVSIQNYSKNHINAVIYSEALDVRWKFSGFYGNLEVCKRRESWALLRHLKSFSPIPWLCCGDFNGTLDASEKKGGARRPGTQMKEFQNALEHCRLCDMGFNGSRYTWSNKRHDDYFTEERLDRVVANLEFASLFPRLCVEVIAARTSDHAPLFCSLQGFTGGQQMGRKIFRFEAWWQKKHGFAKEVKQVWQVKTRHLDTWGVLKTKISNTRHLCLQWKKSNVDPTAGVIEKKTLELAVFQDNVQGSDMDLLNMLQNEVNELIELEELKWHQMSKQEWLQHGDKNSKFFHASVNQRKNKNVINSISNSGGVNVSDPVEVEGALLHHFRTLFVAMPTEGMEGCLSGIERKITLEMNASLLQPCTLEEASLALQEMSPFKSAELELNWRGGV